MKVNVVVVVIATCCQIGSAFLGQAIHAPEFLAQLATGFDPVFALSLMSKPLLLTTPTPVTLRSEERRGKVQITLCESWDELAKAIPVQIDGEGFNAVSEPEAGISEMYQKGSYVFVLVSLTSPSESVKMNSAKAYTLPETSRITNIHEAQQFVSTHGSHFVSAYTRGDALYQVFVFRESKYKALKRKLSQEITKRELIQLLSPMFASAIGPVLSVSREADDNWLRKTLLTSQMFHSYPSLLEVTRKQSLLPLLMSAMSTSSFLSVSLSRIEKLLPPNSRPLITEVVDNTLLLHQENMR